MFQNFSFKSNKKSDLDKISIQLNLVLAEQRMQRSDLQELKRALLPKGDEHDLSEAI